ncbi:MAG TPA: carbon monoxide dehydrogenase [Candidatus Aerophobetes bacterium]|uniref:Carbon monoxide dehydrogenase n=1 Tax=Aerophobetes bacterium TaxID=2030807 RepID=A0A7V0QRR2_UNCAE|nr:carbon monoxide dehydrogenase [Candidatus Aerophobetes bacterium]
MAFTIAVAGKGGVGKTTLSALIIVDLLRKGFKPVLAVDADPNVNLNILLGIEAPQAIGTLREKALEEVKNIEFPAGMSKATYLEYGFQSCLAEGEGFDLMVMGRPEGPGCYCFANDVLRKFIDKLTPNYRYVVIDSEAGMEHLSRRTTQNVDILFMISDSNLIALKSAKRISDLVDELKLNISKRYLVLNNTENSMVSKITEKIKDTGLELAGIIPKDEMLFSFALEEKPLTELPSESVAFIAVDRLLKKTGAV